LLMLLLVGAVLLVHLFGYFYPWFSSDHSTPGYPAIAYLLLWLFLMASVLAVVCFWLDLYRVPAITALALVAFLISWVPANYHYYLVTADRQESMPPVSILIEKAGPRIIMVSAEGGGILASGWTTQVMTGIAERLPEPERKAFLDSIRLLSGVSGG